MVGGLAECAQEAAGEPLGYEAVSTLLTSYAAETARGAGALDEWVDGFLASIASAADGLPTDDQTALVLERRPVLEGLG